MKTYNGDIGANVPENNLLPNEFTLVQQHYKEDYELCERIEKDFKLIRCKSTAHHVSFLDYERKRK
jgi:hypothetical protein